eukprot:jgi/Botrbrau1/1556/Bobra.0107s0044.1
MDRDWGFALEERKCHAQSKGGEWRYLGPRCRGHAIHYNWYTVPRLGCDAMGQCTGGEWNFIRRGERFVGQSGGMQAKRVSWAGHGWGMEVLRAGLLWACRPLQLVHCTALGVRCHPVCVAGCRLLLLGAREALNHHRPHLGGCLPRLHVPLLTWGGWETRLPGGWALSPTSSSSTSSCPPSSSTSAVRIDFFLFMRRLAPVLTLAFLGWGGRRLDRRLRHWATPSSSPSGGLAIGLAFGIGVQYCIKWMVRTGAGVAEQVGLTLAVAYLSYYVANAPAALSGVIAVAVFGLYGTATTRWDMPAKVELSGGFYSFWDTLSFAVNGIVFFYSGAACVNFFVRSSQDLQVQHEGASLWSSIWHFPLVYITIFILRFVLFALFKPLYRYNGAGPPRFIVPLCLSRASLFLYCSIVRACPFCTAASRQACEEVEGGGEQGSDVAWTEIVFATVAGLRGSVPSSWPGCHHRDRHANDPIQTRGQVRGGIMDCLVCLDDPGGECAHAAFLPAGAGPQTVSPIKLATRKRAVMVLSNHTEICIRNLRSDEDEMLRGVDWNAVERFVTTEGIYRKFLKPTDPPISVPP